MYAAYFQRYPGGATWEARFPVSPALTVPAVAGWEELFIFLPLSSEATLGIPER